MRGMSIILPALTVAYATLLVWLGVRIFNRRERWAKRTLAAIVGVPVIYVASFGPACWITSRMDFGADLIPIIYEPVTYGFNRQPDASIRWYPSLGASDSSWKWAFVLDVNDRSGWKWTHRRRR